MATIVNQRPGLGASFGTGINSGVSQLLDAKIKQLIEAPHQQKIADILNSINPQNQSTQPIQNQQQQSPGQEEQNPLQAQQPNQQQQPTQGKMTRQQLAQILPLLPVNEQKIALDAFQKQEESDFKQQVFQEKKTTQQRKEEREAQKAIDARTQPFYDKIIEGEESAKQVKSTLNKLKHLDKNAKVPPAALYNILTSLESIGTKEGAAIGGAIGGALGTGTGALLGGPLGATFGLTEGSAQGAALGAGLGAAIKPVTSLLRSALINQYPDTEEFEKTSLEFLKNVRPLIGGHVTENQLDLFLRSIPTLATTAEGRKTIINNMGILAEGATANFDALEEVIEKNDGKRPDGFEFKVARLADEKRKEYAKRWQD